MALNENVHSFLTFLTMLETMITFWKQNKYGWWRYQGYQRQWPSELLHCKNSKVGSSMANCFWTCTSASRRQPNLKIIDVEFAMLQSRSLGCNNLIILCITLWHIHYGIIHVIP